MDIPSLNIGANVASGLNIRELVTELVQAECQNKKAKHDKDESSANAKISVLGSLKSTLYQFVDTLSRFEDTNIFSDKMVTLDGANTSTFLSATADVDAVCGSYSVIVTQLAQSLKLGTTNTFGSTLDIVGTGNLVLQVGGQSYTVTIDNTNNTVQGVVNAVNALSVTTGIYSYLITSNNQTTIVFSGSASGQANEFSISVENDQDGNNTDNTGLSQLASNNLATLQTAQDSIVSIDGVSITSASNTIENVFNDVTLELYVANPNSTITLCVMNDANKAKNAIIEFVHQYNGIFTKINELTAYHGDDGDNGLLMGDSVLRNIEAKMRRTLYQWRTLQSISLPQIGITSNELTGELMVDESKLQVALTNNYNNVATLFTDPLNGIFSNMIEAMDTYSNINGIMQSRVDGLKKDIDVINDQRLTLERHLLQLEKRLLSHFIAMDKTVAKLRLLSNFLTTQLENLPKPLSFQK